VHVEGQLVFNGTFQMLNAALAGFGLAYVPETSRGVILPRAASDGYSVTGARLIPAITSITRAVVNRRRPSPCLSRRSATVRLDQIRIGNLRGGSQRRTLPNHSFRPPLKNPGRPLWVTSGKTRSEYMFSELLRITDILGSSGCPRTARDRISLATAVRECDPNCLTAPSQPPPRRSAARAPCAAP
jgi:hypothetical protein